MARHPNTSSWHVPLTRYQTSNLLSVPDLLLAVFIEGLPGESWYTTSRGTRGFEDNANRLMVPSSRSLFLNLSRRLTDAQALRSPDLVVVLVGNKSDWEDEREVEWAEASRWATENGASLSNFTPPPFRFQKLIVLVRRTLLGASSLSGDNVGAPFPLCFCSG